jgi:hypothetical protein
LQMGLIKNAFLALYAFDVCKWIWSKICFLHCTLLTFMNGFDQKCIFGCYGLFSNALFIKYWKLFAHIFNTLDKLVLIWVIIIFKENLLYRMCWLLVVCPMPSTNYPGTRIFKGNL